MENYFGFLFVALVLHGFLALSRGIRDVPMTSSSIFDVVAYGAIGDGIHDDTQAFSKAWKDLCGATPTQNTPTLTVAAGKTFLLTPIVFQGPCKSNAIHVEIQGKLVAPGTRSAWGSCSANTWILFTGIAGLTVDGSGEINGKGSIWWNSLLTTIPPINDDDNSVQPCNRPVALQFTKCNGLQLRGLTHVDSPGAHIHIFRCDQSTISNLNIVAPEHSPNTDGIDISHSTQVEVFNSVIATGDDCIAMASMTSHINISGITCGPGHGISIGSLGQNGQYAQVENIHVQNCTFIGSTNGARIKTWQGGLGYARNIVFKKISLQNVQNPIIIDQHYCPGKHGCPTQKSGVEVSNVTYTAFLGTSASKDAISLNCSDTIGCKNIKMKAIAITSSISQQAIDAVCQNAQGMQTSVAPHVPCLH